MIKDKECNDVLMHGMTSELCCHELQMHNFAELLNFFKNLSSANILCDIEDIQSMGVLKSKRQESKIQYLDNVYDIVNMINILALHRFGIHNKAYQLKIKDINKIVKNQLNKNDLKNLLMILDHYADELGITQEYPKWFVETYQQQFVKIALELFSIVNEAYHMQPILYEELIKKKQLQNEAIIKCNVLLAMFNLMLLKWGHTSKEEIKKKYYKPIISLLQNEIELLIKWREDCDKKIDKV